MGQNFNQVVERQKVYTEGRLVDHRIPRLFSIVLKQSSHMVPGNNVGTHRVIPKSIDLLPSERRKPNNDAEFQFFVFFCIVQILHEPRDHRFGEKQHSAINVVQQAVQRETVDPEDGVQGVETGRQR